MLKKKIVSFFSFATAFVGGKIKKSNNNKEVCFMTVLLKEGCVTGDSKKKKKVAFFKLVGFVCKDTDQLLLEARRNKQKAPFFFTSCKSTSSRLK